MTQVSLGRMIRIRRVRKSQMDEQRTKQNDQERDHAALRPSGASRQPLRPLHRSVQVVADAQQAAIRRAVEESFRPVPRGVKSDCEPEITSAPDCQAEKQANHHNLQDAEHVFSRITEMRYPKYHRRKQRARPEAETPAKNEKPITAKGKLLVQRYRQKSRAPTKPIAQNSPAGE